VRPGLWPWSQSEKLKKFHIKGANFFKGRLILLTGRKFLILARATKTLVTPLVADFFLITQHFFCSKKTFSITPACLFFE